MATARAVVSASSAITVAGGATRYSQVPGGNLSPVANEVEAAVTYRTSGTMSALYCRVGSNAASASSSVTLRKNGADGNLTISIGAGATGEFEDTTHSDAISAGDALAYKIVAGSGGAINVSVILVLFAADSGTAKRFCYGTSFSVRSAAGETRYNALTAATITATEADAQAKFRMSGTLQNLFCQIQTNARSSSTTVNSRINGADGTLSVSIPGSTTGAFEDTSNSDAIADGDLVNTAYTLGSGSGGIAFTLTAVDFITASSSFPLLNANITTPTAGSTLYLAPGGGFVVNADETIARSEMNMAARFSRLMIRLSANSHSTDSLLRLRINGSSAKEAVSLPAGVTGFFEDLDNIDTVDAADEPTLELATGTGGTLTATTIGLMVMVPEDHFPAGYRSIPRHGTYLRM